MILGHRALHRTAILPFGKSPRSPRGSAICSSLRWTRRHPFYLPMPSGHRASRVARRTTARGEHRTALLLPGTSKHRRSSAISLILRRSPFLGASSPTATTRYRYLQTSMGGILTPHRVRLRGGCRIPFRSPSPFSFFLFIDDFLSK